MIRDILKYAIGGAVLLSLLGAASQENHLGRFSIFQGVNNWAEKEDQRRIIKLNTETGESWVYLDVAGAGTGVKMGWWPISHYVPGPDSTK